MTLEELMIPIKWALLLLFASHSIVLQDGKQLLCTD